MATENNKTGRDDSDGGEKRSEKHTVRLCNENNKYGLAGRLILTAFPFGSH
jgi:hypothetical protein